MRNKTNKYIPYGRQDISGDDIVAIPDVLKSDFITQGPKIKEFEDALCKYTGAQYAVAVSSGTAALHVACLAAGFKKGDEVITSPITFVASANCVVYCGGKPVFADIQSDTINIDPAEIREKVNRKTRAIIPVHFGGHPADLEEIHKIARKNNLTVIEDAAHAFGAEYKNTKVGSCRYSDMAVFSFHPIKSITTGEGGAVLTNRKDLYERLLIFRNHGITKNGLRFVAPSTRLTGPWYYEMQELGFNYRITDFQCALGISQLKKLDGFLKRRRKIVNIYNNELSELAGITLPTERPYVTSSWHIYYVRIRGGAGRKRAFERLRESDIGVQVHYIPVYLQPYYRKRFKYKEGLCPNAEEYYSETITLPLYPKMTNDQVNAVTRRVREIFGRVC